MSTNALDLLEAEIGGHPVEQSGWDLYRHVLDLARRLEASDRKGLVEALDIWLKQRSSPRTGIAVDVAGELKLAELREGLAQLLEEVRAGKTFLPHDVQWIEKAIQAMS